MLVRRSGIFTVNFENILHNFSGVSIVFFEQVNTWLGKCLT